MKKQERDDLLQRLQARFARHPHRHTGIAWEQVAARLDANPTALEVLARMEASGGEPDVMGRDEASGRGVLATRLHADGRHNELLYVDGGPSTTGTVGKLRMRGREVFRHAVVNLASVLEETLAAAGLAVEAVDWVVPHQANARILDATARKLGLDAGKVVVTVDRHANTSAASVPLALDVAVRDGRINPGDILVLEAMGGGFTWGAAAVRF